MENDKYFVPDIEDFRIGYECEINGSGLAGGMDNWVQYTTKSINNLKGLETFLAAGCLRVPYLTKEQIEAEGWKQRVTEDDIWYLGEQRDYDLILAKKPHYIIILDNDNDVTLFSGYCPSINEFRYICKLLKIT